MDAFEQVVAEILWREGYWVHTAVKVNLTKEEKRLAGVPTAPRWELDIVAYRGRDNALKVVECKSYLDSPGVRLRGFDGTDEKDAARYKLFNKPDLRAIVFNRLRQQFADSGACQSSPTIQLCLACGRIASDIDRDGLRQHFEKEGWELWDETWLRKQLQAMADGGYENQISAVVAKLILRGKAV